MRFCFPIPTGTWIDIMPLNLWAYEGAKLSQAANVSSGDSNQNGTVYKAAHTSAAKQSGDIYQTTYDSKGKVIAPGPFTIPSRAEFWVQPKGGAAVIIMNIP